MIELALTGAISLTGLCFAAWLGRWVMGRPAGDGEMPRVAREIQRAAEGFYRRQSSVIGAVSALLGGAIFLSYGLLRRDGEGDPVPALELGVWLTISFAVGVAGSLATGHVANWVATRASVRAANGARRSLDQALTIALRGGAVSGLFVVAIGLLGLSALYAAVLAYEGGFGSDPASGLRLAPTIPWMIVGYALGASFAALLAQLGGGIFSKAADLGADIAGKELGLAEDDAQNPATIADLAGDGVGDCAGRASAVYASSVTETLGAMILGANLYRDNPSLPSALAVSLFPMVTRAFGVLGAIFGVMVVKTDDREDPRSALTRGLYVTSALHAVGIAGAAQWLLGRAWVPFFACGVIGIGTSIAVLHVTQYYTEHRHRPVRDLAEASRGGPTLTLLAGLSTGVQSAVAPFVIVIGAALGAYYLGGLSGLGGGGLFGTAVATMGMLGTAGYVMAMDAFGPIIDGAGGIVEMCVASERPDVRGRTTLLDAVGNTVKAVTKAYAASAAALSSLVLVSVYLEEVRRRAAAIGQLKSEGNAAAPLVVHLGTPAVYVGALVGILLVLWFVARSLDVVARLARRLVDEVRRQASGPAASAPDPTSGRTADVARRLFVPDHDACVEMAARTALRQMIAPAVVAAVVPVAVGLALRLARTEDNPTIAVDAVAALITAGTIAGVLGSLLAGNAGGAWDNAKKYIVTGAHGGRYLVDETGTRTDNPTYSAAAIGDSVGDPLKDTAGPAIHVLVKMLSVITLVFLPFFI